MLIDSGRTTYLIVEDELPCVQCGKATNQIYIHYEVRMCSDDCVEVLDNEVNERLKELRKSDDKSTNWEDKFLMKELKLHIESGYSECGDGCCSDWYNILSIDGIVDERGWIVNQNLNGTEDYEILEGTLSLLNIPYEWDMVKQDDLEEKWLIGLDLGVDEHYYIINEKYYALDGKLEGEFERVMEDLGYSVTIEYDDHTTTDMIEISEMRKYDDYDDYYDSEFYDVEDEEEE